FSRFVVTSIVCVFWCFCAPALPPLFPYTTLFRSRLRRDHDTGLTVAEDLERPARVGRRHDRLLGQERLVRHQPEVLVERRVVDRSEEHTSELQSPDHLVCRRLLEKQNSTNEWIVS